LNLLLLDEPTNHLDMESSDALLAALDSFDGTVVMVTHNEMFLHALAERLVIFHNDTIEIYEGGYQRFLEKGGWGDEDAAAPTLARDSSIEIEGVKVSKKEQRKKRSEIIFERSKVLNPIERRIEKVEAEIDRHEKKLKDLHDQMQNASLAKDGRKIMEISQSIHESETAIETFFTELEELHAIQTKHLAEFEERLAQIE